MKLSKSTINLLSVICIICMSLLYARAFTRQQVDELRVEIKKSLDQSSGQVISSAYGAISNLIEKPCRIVTKEGYRVYRVCQYDNQGNYCSTMPISDAHDYTSFTGNIRIVFLRDDSTPINNISARDIIKECYVSDKGEYLSFKTKAREVSVNSINLEERDTMYEHLGVCWHLTRKHQEGTYLKDGISQASKFTSYVRSGLYLSSYLDQPVTSLSQKDVEWYDHIVAALKDKELSWLPTIAAFENLKEESITTERLHNYGEWLTLFVDHFKDNVHYWEVGNEMDLKKKSNGWCDKIVIEIYKTAYQAIKKGNPKAQVVIGGLCVPNTGYLDMLAKNKGWDFFDVMNFHSYPPRNKVEMTVLENITRMESFISKSGNVMPIWFTETGASTYIVSEEEQAVIVGRSLLTSLSMGVDKSFVYCLRDIQSVESLKEQKFGLTYNNPNISKPAFKVCETLRKMCPNGSTRPILTRYGSVFVATWKDPQGKWVDTFWTTGESSSLSITTSKRKVEYINYVGETYRVKNKQLNIDDHIVYIYDCEDLVITEL